MILLVGVCMVSSLVWALMDRAQEGSARVTFAFIISIAVCLALAALCLWISKGSRGELLRKEALAIVGLSWLLCGHHHPQRRRHQPLFSQRGTHR